MKEQILHYRYTCDRCDSVINVHEPSSDAADFVVVELGWVAIVGHGGKPSWECPRHGYMRGPRA